MTNDQFTFRIDESNPNYMVIYEGGHPEPSDYRFIMERWAARLDQFEQTDQGSRFGIIIVHGQHEHDEEEHEHERDEEREAEFTKLINDFRRDYRERISVICTGYANIYEASDIEKWYGEGEAGLAQMRERMERFSQYTFGLPAGVFTDIDSAKRWLTDQVNNPQHQASVTNDQQPMANTVVGLFYGSTTGVTEYVAEQIAEAWETAGQKPLVPINITNIDHVSQIVDYEYLVLGIPTWNVGQLQDDWEILFPSLDNLDFRGKKIAVFGIGDAHGYPKNFLDAVGMLGEKLQERGATLVGYWSTEGYDFDESLALIDGQFMGLGIDEVSQADLTETRITQWVQQLIEEFKIEVVMG
ncbi:MAG: flavodoxin [Chloroflexota bacterium]